VTEATPDMATVLDLLRVRGCTIREKDYENQAHWVSLTSLRGHRWAIIAPDDVQGALGFLTMVNEAEL